MTPGVTITWVVALVLLAVTVTGLARRVGWSAPVLLVTIRRGEEWSPCRTIAAALLWRSLT